MTDILPFHKGYVRSLYRGHDNVQFLMEKLFWYEILYSSCHLLLEHHDKLLELHSHKQYMAPIENTGTEIKYEDNGQWKTFAEECLKLGGRKSGEFVEVPEHYFSKEIVHTSVSSNNLF
jgi:hypothetical protein